MPRKPSGMPISSKRLIEKKANYNKIILETLSYFF